MPFKSKKQMRYLFLKEPKIAKRWVKEAKKQGKPFIQSSKKKTFKK